LLVADEMLVCWCPQGEVGLKSLIPATLFAFSGVMYREIVMDLNDLEGDRAARVWTLPVLLGKPIALLTAIGFFLLGNAAAFAQLLHGNGGSGLSGMLQGWLGMGVEQSQAVAEAAPLLVLMWAVWKVGRSAWGVWRSGFDEKVVGEAVDGCLKPVGLGMILLAAAS
jgi:hypothetical protein